MGDRVSQTPSCICCSGYQNERSGSFCDGYKIVISIIALLQLFRMESSSKAQELQLYWVSDCFGMQEGEEDDLLEDVLNFVIFYRFAQKCTCFKDSDSHCDRLGIFEIRLIYDFCCESLRLEFHSAY